MVQKQAVVFLAIQFHEVFPNQRQNYFQLFINTPHLGHVHRNLSYIPKMKEASMWIQVNRAYTCNIYDFCRFKVSLPLKFKERRKKENHLII